MTTINECCFNQEEGVTSLLYLLSKYFHSKLEKSRNALSGVQCSLTLSDQARAKDLLKMAHDFGAVVAIASTSLMTASRYLSAT